MRNTDVIVAGLADARRWLRTELARPAEAPLDEAAVLAFAAAFVPITTDALWCRDGVLALARRPVSVGAPPVHWMALQRATGIPDATLINRWQTWTAREGM